MDKKKVYYDEEARRALEKGVDAVANPVKLTLGPAGRNVVLDRQFGGTPQIVNDGVTIAKEISLEDPLENVGAKLLKSVCVKANEEAGDGTTTAAVLAQAMVKEGLRNVAAGANPIQLRKGMQKASIDAVAEIKAMSRKVETATEIAQVASISAGSEEGLGALIAEAMEKVGRDGVITVEDSKSLDTSLKVEEGMQFDKGLLSPYFLEPGTQEVVLNNPYVLLIAKNISLLADLVPILEQIAQTQRPVLIVADSVDGDALTTLVVNNSRKLLKCCAVAAPSFGDNRKGMMEDIAILTGGVYITEDLGTKLENVTLDMGFVGDAKQVKVTKDRTIIVSHDDSKEMVLERVQELKDQKEATDSDFNKDKIQERIAKLTTGVAVIRVGGATEVELRDRKLRLEDALNSTRAAVEEGFVPGGGTCLLEVSEALAKRDNPLTGDEKTGYEIVLKALCVPVRQIADNAGVSGEVVVNSVKESPLGIGYDALNHKYIDMIEAGIIDPAKVERCAVQYATSITGLFLTTQALVVDVSDPKQNSMGGFNGQF